MEEHIPIIGDDYLIKINLWAMTSYELNNINECFTILSEDWGLNILSIYYIMYLLLYPTYSILKLKN